MPLKPQTEAARTRICLYEEPGEMKSLENVTVIEFVKPVYVVMLLEADWPTNATYGGKLQVYEVAPATAGTLYV